MQSSPTRDDLADGKCAVGDLAGDMRADLAVPVLASQADVALARQGLEALLRKADQGNVEGSAAQIIDEHGLLFLGPEWARNDAVQWPGWLQRISQRGSGGL